MAEPGQGEAATFFTLLEERVAASSSLLCIGLDPHESQLPVPKDVNTARVFCLDIVAKTHEYAAAFKPNCAFFEAFGAAGVDALKDVIRAIPRDIPVILDCKRGDIDTTAQAYAHAAYDILSARDEGSSGLAAGASVTLSPYMGWDSVQPFVTGSNATKGAFVLCKTSNPSSSDIQDRRVINVSGGEPSPPFVYEMVAELCNSWNTRQDRAPGNIGLVAGATDTAALARVRAAAPSLWILCPGVGAQGGEPEPVCKAGLRLDGSGLLVSVSRGISRAKDMAQAARELRDEVNACRAAHAAKTPPPSVFPASAGASSSALETYQSDFLSLALSKKVLQFGRFTLKSGRISPYFFNAGLFSCGQSMHLLSRYYAQAVRASKVEFDVIFGPAYKGIPLAACIAAAWFDLYGESKDYCYNRKEAKDHGEGGTLVGASMSGRRVLVVDDVITAGTAIRESVDILAANGGSLCAVAVCLDRQEKVATASGLSEVSAIQDVQRDLSVPVLSVACLRHLVAFVESQQTAGRCLDIDLAAIRDYRAQFGVDY